MAKNVEEDRLNYLEKSRLYKQPIDTILKWEENVLNQIRKKSVDAVMLKRLSLMEDMLNLASYYIILNSISKSMLKQNNENALNAARKTINKSISYLEDIVSDLVDASFSEYEDRVAALKSVDPEERYRLVRKMGLTIDLLKSSFLDNSKWRWSFVEIEGRFAAVTKNIFDFKNGIVNMDPRSPHHAATVYHLRLIKTLLNNAADRYRERYELSTNYINDFQESLNFMNALRRIHIILGEGFEAEMIKKKLDVWEIKLKRDMNRKQEGKNL